MLHAVLRVLSGRQNGALIPLPVGKFLIGREEDCQLRPNSELVSRHHCVFTNDDFTVRLRDLGSTNGTKVNGQRLTRGALLPGDELAFGSQKFRVHLGPGEPEAGHDEKTEMLSVFRGVDDDRDESELVAVDSVAESDSDVRLLPDDGD